MYLNLFNADRYENCGYVQAANYSLLLIHNITIEMIILQNSYLKLH